MFNLLMCKLAYSFSTVIPINILIIYVNDLNVKHHTQLYISPFTRSTNCVLQSDCK